jgi:hypothetical protein
MNSLKIYSGLKHMIANQCLQCPQVTTKNLSNHILRLFKVALLNLCQKMGVGYRKRDLILKLVRHKQSNIRMKYQVNHRKDNNNNKKMKISRLIR